MIKQKQILPSSSWRSQLSPELVEEIDNLTYEDLIEARARVKHIEFMKYCWQRANPFLLAADTPFQQSICNEIDNAFARYRQGLSTYLCLLVPSGHGKSDISSRYLPAHFLGEFPDDEAMVISHTDDKVNEFGGFGRMLMESDQFADLYPMVRPGNGGVGCIGIENRLGKSQYESIASGSAGKRANLIVVDDFFGKREQAESAELREKVWQRICEDFMSRRAPVTIVLWVVTPWHVDDPIARVQKKMAADPDYPQFKIIKYPAESEKYPSGFLFPERYNSAWYNDQRKLLGPYGYQATMQCDPQMRGGNMLNIGKIKLYRSLSDGVSVDGDPMPWAKVDSEGKIYHELSFVRAWDIASSVKQTDKADPDFTFGEKGAVHWEPSAVEGIDVPVMVLEDVVYGQWEAPQRQRIIRDTAIGDGHIRIGVEAFGGYKDAYTLLAEVLRGLRTVEDSKLPGDKKAKMEPIVPIMEAGNFWMKIAPWNEIVLKHLGEFPSGTHDDGADPLPIIYDMCRNNSLPGMLMIG
jgi:predicted phage terminase large subunit-like protein